MPNIKFNNLLSAANLSTLKVLLTCNSISPTNNWPAGKIGIGNLPGSWVLWSSLTSDFKENGFTFDSIISARLYVGYGDLASPPLPNDKTYYGWIEFSYNAGSDASVWLNLSNVDITGLPLAVSGTNTVSAGGGTFSLGYKVPHNTLVSDLEAILTNGTNSQAYIICETGVSGYTPIKIAGPDIFPTEYPSFTNYRDSLRNALAPLTIKSDTPPGGSAITFTGSFLPVSMGNVLEMTGEGGSPTFVIQEGQLSDEIIYKCDGGTIIYDGNSINDNSSNIVASSVFRELMVGFNEGYFTTEGPNNSNLFDTLTPFASGNGNQYAQIINENTNSYGFPYADSNLKVLANADPTAAITLTLIPDDMAYGYESTNIIYEQPPISGKYQFGIGANSSSLGNIIIGNSEVGYFEYQPNTVNGSYGGFLPASDACLTMKFTGINQSIWINEPKQKISNANCFSSSPSWQTIQQGHKLTWGANVTWIAGCTTSTTPPDWC